MSLYGNNLAVISKNNSPVLAIGILIAVALFGIFVTGYDQGHLFSMVQGNEAYGSMLLHEFTHDIRHASGFPCH
ncbi:MAG: CbtB-domain containing protein [Thermoproteota archaeon]|nr:CbtB-domain containing protein [Thermoproteota archaeon]